MICRECGNPVPDNQPYCPYCGSDLRADQGSDHQPGGAEESFSEVNQHPSEGPTEVLRPRPQEPVSFTPAPGYDDYYDGFDSGNLADPADSSPARVEEADRLPVYGSNEDLAAEQQAVRRAAVAAQPAGAYVSKRRRRRLKKGPVLVLICILLLLAGGLFYWLRLRPTGVADRLIAAVQKNDAAAVLDLVSQQESGAPLTDQERQAYAALFAQADYREQLLEDLKAGNATDFILRQDGAEEWYVLRTYPARLETNRAKALVKGDLLEKATEVKDGGKEFAKHTAGLYHLNVHYPDLLGENPKGQDYTLLLTYSAEAMHNGVYVLDARREVVKVQIDDKHDEAKILVNGEDSGVRVSDLADRNGIFGPVVKQASLSLAYEEDGKLHRSQPVAANKDGVLLHFNFSDVRSLQARETGKTNQTEAAEAGAAAGSGNTASGSGSTSGGEDSSGGAGSSGSGSASGAGNKSGGGVAKAALPYSETDLEAARAGRLTQAIKDDVTKAVVNFLREDVQAARSLDASVYSNLAEPQLSRQKDWLKEMAARGMSIQYTPVRADFWNNSWQVSYENGELKVIVTETCRNSYQLLQDGAVIETADAADRWTHYLRYDQGRRAWVISQNEVPADSEPATGGYTGMTY